MSARRRWTEAEDNILRRLYARRRGGAMRCAELLPGRTVTAIRERAKRILPRARREARWTSSEDKILTLSWGDQRKTLAAKLPGRSWLACISRAWKLGLPTVARMDGVVSMHRAAVDSGYDEATLRAILGAKGVRVATYHGGEGAGAKDRKCPRYAVDPDEVREAVEQHLRESEALETIVEAARRHGTSRDTMRRALEMAGLVGPAQKAPRKLHPTDVDTAWSRWVTRPGTGRCDNQRAEERAA